MHACCMSTMSEQRLSSAADVLQAVSGRVDAAFSGTDYAMAADNEHIFYMSKAHLESLGLKTTKPSALTPKPSRRRRLLRG